MRKKIRKTKFCLLRTSTQYDKNVEIDSQILFKNLRIFFNKWCPSKKNTKIPLILEYSIAELKTPLEFLKQQLAFPLGRRMAKKLTPRKKNDKTKIHKNYSRKNAVKVEKAIG